MLQDVSFHKIIPSLKKKKKKKKDSLKKPERFALLEGSSRIIFWKDILTSS